MKTAMSSSILFREILPEDIQAIFNVRIATWHNDRGYEELAQLGITHESGRNLLKTSHRGWLCEVDSRIVGFAMGNQSSGEMWVIAVLEEFEGKGIGKRLLNLVEQWLFSEGWKEIWLTTDPNEGTRAVGFYRHLGWTDWKIEPDEGRFMKKPAEQSQAVTQLF
ncbi:GNAT family N-acetyltransferase [Leptolyngbya sp. O-77]|uniref:GNAT family N-acetyltransferase n=1 Tax=Leptolyngbya sp. O-77 TaxID=1080068 RepID=UPI00074D429C|nr:GNAT family N-acetyltransferase [Leptolyngbya sp. O-77]BAU42152.1 Acetyltransferase YpeA [Leptolyngbya sp. O-77]